MHTTWSILFLADQHCWCCVPRTRAHTDELVSCNGKYNNEGISLLNMPPISLYIHHISRVTSNNLLDCVRARVSLWCCTFNNNFHMKNAQPTGQLCSVLYLSINNTFHTHTHTQTLLHTGRTLHDHHHHHTRWINGI